MTRISNKDVSQFGQNVPMGTVPNGTRKEWRKMEDNCIFCKIIRGEIPSDVVYEDEEIIAFHDIHPAAPIHVLVIPKKHIPNLTCLEKEDERVIGKIYTVINQIAAREKIAQRGFRVIVNCGEDGGQEVGHLHFHILGGKKLGEKIVH